MTQWAGTSKLVFIGLNLMLGREPDDRTMDVHRFEGVYGDYQSAHRASGPKGSPLSIKI
ncbi:hypothetical protein R75461_05910 [Paraburkholderia nemoris]|nr:hypothetical protein R75461_05910 [Paraburkholderia nemoris]